MTATPSVHAIHICGDNTGKYVSGAAAVNHEGFDPVTSHDDVCSRAFMLERCSAMCVCVYMNHYGARIHIRHTADARDKTVNLRTIVSRCEK